MTTTKTVAVALALGAWLTAHSPAMAQTGSASVQVELPDGEAEGGSTEPTWWLVGVGAGLFFGEYLVEIAVTAALDGSAEELERAAIPLVGVWLDLADGGQEWWEVALGVYEGVMQVAALTAMVIGFAWQQPTEDDSPPEATVTFAPMALPGGGGLAALGAFR